MQQVIPLTSEPNQTLTTTVQINGVNTALQYTLRWNGIAGYWVMGLTDIATGEMVFDSVPLVTGINYTETINILRKLAYLEVGEAYLVCLVSKPITDYPSDTTMGTDFALVWEDNL
jgi:hypothetical protein